MKAVHSSRGSAYLLFNGINSKYRFRATKFAIGKGFKPVYPSIIGDFFDVKQDKRKENYKTNGLIKNCKQVWVFGKPNASVWDHINFAKKFNKDIRFFKIEKDKFEEVDIFI